MRVLGDPDNDWRFERSSDLVVWTADPSLGTLVAGNATDAPHRELPSLTSPLGFLRAVRTEGFTIQPCSGLSASISPRPIGPPS